MATVVSVGSLGTVGTVGTVGEQVGQVQPAAQVEQMSQVKQADGAGDERADEGFRGGGPVDGPDAWLLPMTAVHAGQGLRPPSPTNVEERFETGPYLGVEFGEFRRLLRWTLAQSRSAVERSGAVLTEELAALFDRFRLRVDVWIEAVANFRTWFRTAIGLGDALKSFAKRLGVAWLAGQGRRRHPFTE